MGDQDKIGVLMPDGQVVSLFDMAKLAADRWSITPKEVNALVFEEAKIDMEQSIESADTIARNFLDAGVDASIHFLLGKGDPYWAYVTLIWRMAQIANNR